MAFDPRSGAFLCAVVGSLRVQRSVDSLHDVVLVGDLPGIYVWRGWLSPRIDGGLDLCNTRDQYTLIQI